MGPTDLIIPDLLAAAWRKSSHSGNNGGECVEVATNLPGVVAIRDSKTPNSRVITLTPHSWRRFLAGVRGGQFRA